MLNIPWGHRTRGEQITIISGKLAFVLEGLSHIRFLVDNAFNDKTADVDALGDQIINELCELLERYSKEEHDRMHELFKSISNMSIDKVPFKYDER